MNLQFYAHTETSLPFKSFALSLRLMLGILYFKHSQRLKGCNGSYYSLAIVNKWNSAARQVKTVSSRTGEYLDTRFCKKGI